MTIEPAEISNLVLQHKGEIERLKTPCYVFFRDQLRNRVKAVAGTLENELGLIYSVKANPNPEILRLMRDHVSGFDVSSIQESRLLHTIGIKVDQLVSFVGPAKSLGENIEFLSLFPKGIVVAESIEEIEELRAWAESHKREVECCLRIDLAEKAGPNGRTYGHALQFGVTEQEAVDYLRSLVRSGPLNLLGFHFHTFSQHRDHISLSAHYAGVHRFLELACSDGYRPELVNFGSGMGLSYFESSPQFDLSAFKESIGESLTKIRALLAPRARLFMESGRYLVGPAGVFLTRIVRKKKRDGETFIILDGGFAQSAMITGVHMPVRKNFKHHALSRGASTGAAATEVTAFGPSCSIHDIVLQKAALPAVAPGDLIWFENMGAYGKTFSPNGFLSFASPEEYFL